MESSPPPDPRESPPRPDPAEAPGNGPSRDERNLAVLAHLGGIVTSFGVPVVVWLARRADSEFVEDQAREALNFQITMLPIYFAASVLIPFCIGMPLFTLAFLVNAVLCVAAAMGAKEGRRHRYPFGLRLVS